MLCTHKSMHCIIKTTTQQAEDFSLTQTVYWLYTILILFRGLSESSSSRKRYFSCLKMRSTNPFESFKNHTFDDIWSIPLLNHNGKISKRYFKTSCMTLVQNTLIFIPSYYQRAKTGLWPGFYLNCSHVLSSITITDRPSKVYIFSKLRRS